MVRRRILVADDSATIQKVIKIAFSRHGYDIVEAASFIEAITAMTRLTADIVIADASLPGAHGPSDFLKIAHDGRVPLLLLVGSYESVDEDSFRSLGFSHFLKKPFESSDIVSLVDQLIADMGEKDEPKAGGVNVDRSQHTTVFHEGGIGLSFSEDHFGKTDPLGRPLMHPEGSGLGIPPPPPPPPPNAAMTQTQGFIDETKKGRKAFSLSGDDTGPNRPSQASLGFTVPPPPPGSHELPPKFNLDHSQDHQRTTLPSIPSDLGLMSQSSDMDTMPSPVDLKPWAKPRERLEKTQRPTPETLPWQPVQDQAAVSGQKPNPDNYLEKIAKMVEESVDDQLPPLVRKAIEDYCERHFKTLAREVITNELRRLAEEKARHLVDN
jgi:CheY-like chemotaxis protein